MYESVPAQIDVKESVILCCPYRGALLYRITHKNWGNNVVYYRLRFLSLHTVSHPFLKQRRQHTVCTKHYTVRSMLTFQSKHSGLSKAKQKAVHTLPLEYFIHNERKKAAPIRICLIYRCVRKTDTNLTTISTVA